MLIIAILAAIAIPSYVSVLKAGREAVLKEDLHVMRGAIDAYTMDKGKAPQSLDDLVQAGYLREIPTDPTTHSKDTWTPDTDTAFTDINESDPGITDVHSGSTELASDGQPYSRLVAPSSLPQKNVAVADVYLCYLALCELARSLDGDRRNLSHQLVLCEPISLAGEAPIIAASIASAASITIESDPSAVRQGTRGGAIDFTVNNLDEALRALKNEIRKGLSIAVCLEGNPQQMLVQMAERGVQPDVICCSGEPGALLRPFLDREARVVDPTKTPAVSGTIDTTWRVQQLPGKWLPLIDELVASCLPDDDDARRTWLKRAPRYLDRLLRSQRYLPLTDEEMAAVRDALQERRDDAEWAGVDVAFERAIG